MIGGLVIGGILFLAGVVRGGSVGVIATAGFFVALFFVGLVIVIVALAMGLQAGKGSSKSVCRYDNVNVIARYVMNGLGETIFDESYIDPEDPKTRYFVRLAIPGLGSAEYGCEAAVWGQCGEGMVGMALIQGPWCGQFVSPTSVGPTNPYGRDTARP
jgi:hypothetical protein